MATNSKYLKPDNKGRIQLGKLAKDVVRYRVVLEENGVIQLYPEVAIPMDEVWLYKNKKALSSVMAGLEQAHREETVSRGSFSQYLDD